MWTGYSNCIFAVFSDAAKGDGELFTTVHSIFSFFRGIAILSVGPVGVQLLRHSPTVILDSYAIGKYKVCWKRVNDVHDTIN